MKYVKPDRPKQARGALKRVYDEVRDVFPGGEVPGPYLVHSFFPDFLAVALSFHYESPREYLLRSIAFPVGVCAWC